MVAMLTKVKIDSSDMDRTPIPDVIEALARSRPDEGLLWPNGKVNYTKFGLFVGIPPPTIMRHEVRPRENMIKNRAWMEKVCEATEKLWTHRAVISSAEYGTCRISNGPPYYGYDLVKGGVSYPTSRTLIKPTEGLIPAFLEHLEDGERAYLLALQESVLVLCFYEKDCDELMLTAFFLLDGPTLDQIIEKSRELGVLAEPDMYVWSNKHGTYKPYAEGIIEESIFSDADA